MARTRNANEHDQFLQGVACGFCLCLDMIRDKGMKELPDPLAQGFVMFADGAEASLKNTEFGALLAHCNTPELREKLLKRTLDAYRDREGA